MSHAGRSRRRSIRLRDYDYSQVGAYFVTICTYNRELFLEDASIRQIAETCWKAIPDHSPDVVLDEWVIMLNHLHGILVLADDRREIGEDNRRGVQLNAPTRDRHNPFSAMSPQRRTLSVVIRTYKAAVTTLCRRAGHDFAWQRNYFEHVVRDEDDLSRIRRYIRDNPLCWDLDENNPACELAGSK